MTRFQHGMRQLWDGVRGDRVGLSVLGVAAVCDGLTWLTVSRLTTRTSSLVSLHYTIYFGPDLTVQRPMVWVLPLFGLMIVVMNLGLTLIDRAQLWRRTLAFISLMMNILLLATSLTLVYVSRI